jgi:hypothetical protein
MERSDYPSVAQVARKQNIRLIGCANAAASAISKTVLACLLTVM